MESAPTRDRIVFGALLVVAAALRVLHLTWGLPSLIEEAMPLRVALAMIDPASGTVNLDPHFFNYPSFSIYLHLAGAQLVYAVGHVLGAYRSYADFLLSFDIDPSPVLIVGRLIHAIADVGTVWAVWRIGRRVSPATAWIAAGLAAFSPVLLRTERTIIVDTLAACLLAWSLERLLAWIEHPAQHRLFASAALLGLAASTKYPAAAFAIPLVAAVGWRRPPHAVRLVLGALGVAALAFLVTSPYVVLDWRESLRGILFERRHMAIGHLGSEQRASLGFHAMNLLATLGPLGAALLCLSPVLIRDSTRRAVAVPLLLGFAVLVLPIVVVRYDAERYLAPAVPFACAIAAMTATWALERAKPRARPWAWGLIAAGIWAPVVFAGTRAACTGWQDTQRLAQAWCGRSIPHSALVVEEGWSAPLVSVTAKDALARGPRYAHAGAAVRARFDAVPAFHVIDIPTRVTGTLPPQPGGGGVLEAIDLNPAYYDPALYAAADYIVTSSAIGGRYSAHPARFAAPIAFYSILEHHADLVAHFAASAAVSGPEIRVYRVNDACRAELRREALAEAWWMPRSLEGPAGAPADQSAGRLAEWRRAVYGGYFARFAEELTYASLWRGDTLTAEHLARAAVAVDPADPTGVIVTSVCLGARGAWHEAEAVLAAALAADPGDGPVLLQLSRVEARLGRTQLQRTYLAEIERLEPPGSPIRRAAELEIDRGTAR